MKVQSDSNKLCTYEIETPVEIVSPAKIKGIFNYSWTIVYNIYINIENAKSANVLVKS